MSYVLEISDFLKDYYDSLTEEQKKSKYGKLLKFAYYHRLIEEFDEFYKKYKQINDLNKNIDN